MEKPQRASNFTKDEEELLVLLVEKYKRIIECKKSNAVSWKEKEAPWKNVEKEFNASNGRNGYRAVKHLKEKYNLKKRVKQKFTETRTNVMKTGGGSYIPPTYTDIDISIKEILGEQTSGFPTAYDCDGTASTFEREGEEIIIETIVDNNDQNYETELPEMETVTDFQFKENETNDDGKKPENTDSEVNDWSTYTSRSLKRPISSKLDTNKNKVTKMTNKSVFVKDGRGTKKYIPLNTKLIEEKLEFVRLQRKTFLEEHDLKMQILRNKVLIQNRDLNISVDK